MPKSLADGKKKFTILTTKPANPAAPTVAELNAGINGELYIMFSDFTWSAADSDTVDEKELYKKGNAQALGASNWEGSVTAFRYFNAVSGAADPAADVVFAAVKTKGTRLWCYARETGKDATANWAAGDEIYLGGEVTTDTPKAGEGTGYTKRQCRLLFDDGWDNIVAAA